MVLTHGWLDRQQIAISEYDATKHGRLTDEHGATLIAKRGQVKIHHFARDVTHHSGEQKMTDWHRKWQAVVAEQQREQRINRDGVLHIADLVTVDGRVIELQHSPISVTEINERERFYGRDMIWIFDLTAFKSTKLLLTNGAADLYSSLVTRRATTALTYYDVGGYLLELQWVNDRLFFGQRLAYQAFYDRYFPQQQVLTPAWLQTDTEVVNDHTVEFNLADDLLHVNGLAALVLAELPTRHRERLVLAVGVFQWAGGELVTACAVCHSQPQVTEPIRRGVKHHVCQQGYRLLDDDDGGLCNGCGLTAWCYRLVVGHYSQYCYRCAASRRLPCAACCG